MSDSKEFAFNQCVRNAQEDRQYAYFRVTSEHPLNDLESRLGMTPIRFWNKGDIVERGGRKFRRRQSSFQVESGLKESDPLVDHILTLHDKLEPKAEELSSLDDRCRCAIVCVSYSAQSMELSLSSEILRRIADLSLDIEFDLYALVEPHDALVEARSLMALHSGGAN
ncbi:MULTISPECIES: DUF4279 domain-containing protein [Shimia]|uniref:DUF4279 domain-containing protein n=1 Tax=Shimia TaxID=573139 RepID=UPI001FB43B22|nr:MULTISPECIES: DUF4279 domain-containing protein [Shimia]MDV4146332.1 DUF4279 domain-containing protein [Shimia sp. FJ5]